MLFGLWRKPVPLKPLPATDPDDPGPFFGAKKRELTEQIESKVVELPDGELPPR